MIVADPRNPTALALRERLEAELRGRTPRDVVVVLGGDGFLLQTIHRQGLDATYLGLNAGHLGFLLNDLKDWSLIGRAVAEGEHTVTRFPVLSVRATLTDGGVPEDLAINDVYLERASSQTARLSLAIDGHLTVDKLVSDGLIFSTALGSTAYTFSAGGPACHPTLPILTVTPICPHAPRLHPFALPTTATAHVEVLSGEHRPVNAVADGRPLGPVTAVDVRFDGREVALAHLPGHDFTARMIEKILRP